MSCSRGLVTFLSFRLVFFFIPVSNDNFFYCDTDLWDRYFPGFSLFFAGTLVFEVLIFVFVLGDLGGLFISLVDCKFYLL